MFGLFPSSVKYKLISFGYFLANVKILALPTGPKYGFQKKVI